MHSAEEDFELGKFIVTVFNYFIFVINHFLHTDVEYAMTQPLRTADRNASDVTWTMKCATPIHVRKPSDRDRGLHGCSR